MKMAEFFGSIIALYSLVWLKSIGVIRCVVLQQWQKELSKGSIAIVKIGEKSIKVKVD
jgi:hypothetical protein